MSKRLPLLPQAMAIASVVAGLASMASAQQSLVQSSAVIVALTADPVNDSAGLAIPNLTFSTSTGVFDECTLDESGNVVFRAQIFDSMNPVTTWNDRVIMYGSSRSNLKMVVRGGAQAPTMLPGVLLRTSSGLSSSISSTIRITPDGRTLWGASVDDVGASITSNNNDCLFGGPFGNQSLLVRDGDIAPGTGALPGQEAEFAQAFSSPSFNGITMNSNGVIAIQATLRDVAGSPSPTMPPVVLNPVGSNNQAGMWVGLPGNLELVVRKNDPVQGLGGEDAIDDSNTLIGLMTINDSNKLLFEVRLSTLGGAPAATTANDRVVMVHTLGGGNQKLVREGDPAPGTVGAIFGTHPTAGSWTFQAPVNSWLRTNEVIFHTDLRDGDVSSTVNNTAIYRGGIGTLTMVARKGDVAPGTGGATWLSLGNLRMQHNVSGRVAIHGSLVQGGGVTTANDSGIWTGLPGSLQLIAREGDVAPGTGGSTFAGMAPPTVLLLNDLHQVLFQVILNGGGSPGTSLWLWDPVVGLRPVMRNGDQFEISPGVFKSITSFGSIAQEGNTDGAGLTFGHDGQIALRLLMSDGIRAIVRVLPETIAEPYCFGDGSGTACPCSPAPVPHGDPDKGCPNNLFPGGAKIAATGVASIRGDTLKLTVTNVPNGGGCVAFQGSGNLGGNGFVFGDGLRCANGTMARLLTHIVVANTYQYPDAGLGDNSISQRLAILLPGTRYYQGWYRSANAAFCTPDLFNLTNGLQITWAP